MTWFGSIHMFGWRNEMEKRILYHLQPFGPQGVFWRYFSAAWEAPMLKSPWGRSATPAVAPGSPQASRFGADSPRFGVEHAISAKLDANSAQFRRQFGA